MSLNINTIADKPQFRNYFSNPLTFPKNANIALPKANLQVPILVQPELSVPDVGAGNYDLAAFFCQIDGILESISYTELFNAHVALEEYSTENLSVGLTIDEYYANYKFLPDNGVLFNSEGINSTDLENRMKIPLSMIMCKALNTKFNFYDFSSDDKYSGQGYALDNQLVGQSTVLSIQKAGTGAPITGTTITASGQSLRELAFNVVYDPQKRGNQDPVSSMDFANSSFNDNWGTGVAASTPVGANLILNEDTNYAMASSNKDAAGFSIDPNGGWIRFTPQNNIGTNNSTMACGLILTGTPATGNYSNAFEIASPDFTIGVNPALNLIDIGFMFSQDAGIGGDQELTFGIIDNGRITTESVADIPYPAGVSTFITYTQGETFFIHIKRGSLLNGTNKFIFSLFSGNGALNPPDSTDNLLYVCERTFAGGDIEPGFIALANPVAADNATVGFNSVQFIPKSEQSREQGSYFETTPINEGASMVNSISITSVVDGDLGNTGAYEFWYQYGLSDVANGLPFNTGNQQIFGKDINNLVRKWSVTTNFSENDMVYYIGNTTLNNIYTFDDNGFFVANPNPQFQLQSLPQQLQVALNNIDVKNFAGNYIAGGSNANLAGGILQNTSTNRVIGTIPIPVDQVGQDSVVLNLQYEPFNLIYRPINNPISFTINELDVDIFYRDFRTGQRKTIDSLVGTVELDIHVKTGAPPAKITNDGLRPF